MFPIYSCPDATDYAQRDSDGVHRQRYELSSMEDRADADADGDGFASWRERCARNGRVYGRMRRGDRLPVK